MPKLPFKRKAADENASLSAYIPAHMVDYTSLPPIEEDTAITRFTRLPLVVRIGAVLLPILLLVGTAWTIWQFYGAPPTEAVAPPRPTITIDSATVASRDAIVVEARVDNAANGTPVSGQLLRGDAATAWADVAQSKATVANGKVTLRLVKDEAAEARLEETASYTVELTVGEATDAVSAQRALDVPSKLRSAFFGTIVAEATPEPTPTVKPTAEPRPEPTPEPAGPPTLQVTLDATLLISPTLGTTAVARAASGASFQPLLRTANNQWFLVQQDQMVGWLNAEQIEIDPASSAAIPLVTPDPAAISAGQLKATVFNGGNIRYRADVKTGTVLGQLHAGQEIALVARTADSQWLHVIAPEAEGFVSVSLLQIDPAVLNKVPVAENNSLDVRPVGRAAPPSTPSEASGGTTTDEPATSGGTDGAATNLLSSAFNKSQTLSSYRFDFTMSGKLPLGALPTGTNAQTTTLIQIAGDVSGKNAHLTVKGLTTTLLGADAAKGVQLMLVDQQVYIHGPLSFSGMTENTWYKLSAATTRSFSSSQTGSQADIALAQRLFASAFTRTSTQSLDGQQCEVYHAGKAELIALVNDLQQAAGPDAGSSFEESLEDFDLDRLDLDLWACADGYLHQGQMSMKGRGKGQSGQDVAVDLRVHIYDLNQKITIVAPTNATELKDLDFSGILSNLEN